MSALAERRQEEKDRRRAEIIDAAIEVYREINWDGVTIDQVAKRARLSRALVYVYFKDKDELHCAICTRALDLLAARFAEASSRARLGIDKVDALGRAYIAYAHELPHFFDACARFEALSPVVEDPNSPVAECMAAAARVHDHAIAAIKVGIEDGSIRRDIGDPKVTSYALWGCCHGIIQIAVTKAHALALQGIAVPELIEHALRMFRSMLAR